MFFFSFFFFKRMIEARQTSCYIIPITQQFLRQKSMKRKNGARGEDREWLGITVA